jgi:hypothetical protein
MAAGVIGVISFGAQLSKTLFEFANTMISAREEMLSIAQEVAQSSAVLNGLRKAVYSQDAARYPPSTFITSMKLPQLARRGSLKSRTLLPSFDPSNPRTESLSLISWQD